MESGPMTVTRLRVHGAIPDDFQEIYRDRLNTCAFKEHVAGAEKEQEGWVLASNLLSHEFDNMTDWLFNEYIVFSLRVDKRTLPGILFKAHLQKRCENWAKDNQVERCPKTIRMQLKEDLEAEWMLRAFPQVAITELCWNWRDGYVVVYSQTESTLDRVKKRFKEAFNLQLKPWCILDDLDASVANDLAYSAPISAFKE
jgi:recombination associated protein RdgC